MLPLVSVSVLALACFKAPHELSLCFVTILYSFNHQTASTLTASSIQQNEKHRSLYDSWTNNRNCTTHKCIVSRKYLIARHVGPRDR